MTSGYDAAGNLLGDGIVDARYDAEGRICAVRTTFSSGVLQYVYDPGGNRVAKVTGTSFTCLSAAPDSNNVAAKYLDGTLGQQITELDGQNNWQHSSIYVGGEILATYDKNGVYFPVKDNLGSLRVQVNGSGTIDQTCINLPFGDGQNCNGSDISEQHFTGKERDIESGLDYFGARYMASSGGRFMSPDPSRLSVMPTNPQTWNRFSYANNNPLRFVDGNGKWPTDIHHQIIDKAFPNLSPAQRQILKT